VDVKLNIFDGSAHRFSKVVHLPCTIGRSRLSHISIVHPLVSRQHCEIYEDNGLVMLRDLGSLNGTYFKNARIGRGVALPFGEVFSIGPIHFVIEKAAAQPSEAHNSEESTGWKMDQPQMGRPSSISRLSSEQDAKGDSLNSFLTDPLFGGNRTGDGSSVTQAPSLGNFDLPKPKEAPGTNSSKGNDSKGDNLKAGETKPRPSAAKKPQTAEPARNNSSGRDLPGGDLFKEFISSDEPSDEAVNPAQDNADKSDDFDFLWDEMFNKK